MTKTQRWKKDITAMSKNTKYQKKKYVFFSVFYGGVWFWSVLLSSVMFVCGGVPFAVSLCRYLLFMAVFVCGRVPFAVSLRCLCSFLLFMAVLVYAGVPFVSSFCSWLCWRRFFAVAVCLVFPFCFFCSLLSFVLSLSLCSCALATVDILQCHR
ncbi:MAG: hypothetical protein GY928_00675 [Colwellia sp.]|nr:hypothetical protein [Colwellia sp.]